MNISQMNEPFAANIEKLIHNKGLKKKAIAEKMGVGPNRISEYLNGRRIIKAVDIALFSSALGVTPNDLFGIPNRTPPKKR